VANVRAITSTMGLKASGTSVLSSSQDDDSIASPKLVDIYVSIGSHEETSTSLQELRDTIIDLERNNTSFRLFVDTSSPGYAHYAPLLKPYLDNIVNLSECRRTALWDALKWVCCNVSRLNPEIDSSQLSQMMLAVIDCLYVKRINPEQYPPMVDALIKEAQRGFGEIYREFKQGAAFSFRVLDDFINSVISNKAIPDQVLYSSVLLTLVLPSLIPWALETGHELELAMAVKYLTAQYQTAQLQTAASTKTTSAGVGYGGGFAHTTFASSVSATNKENRDDRVFVPAQGRPTKVAN
jgi:hypothetical protein